MAPRILIGLKRVLRINKAEVVFVALTVAAFSVVTSCRSSAPEHDLVADVNLTAPVSGVVRRVLVNEGAAVENDAAILEIAVVPEKAKANNAAAGNQALAARAAQTDLAAAEGEARRTADGLQRIQPLVKQGLASQAELDKARAEALDANRRLATAREKAQNTVANSNQRPANAPAEEIVSVRAPSAGTVRALNVHAGQQIGAGESVATLAPQT